jgi:hypothetical protein
MSAGWFQIAKASQAGGETHLFVSLQRYETTKLLPF